MEAMEWSRTIVEGLVQLTLTVGLFAALDVLFRRRYLRKSNDYKQAYLIFFIFALPLSLSIALVLKKPIAAWLC